MPRVRCLYEDFVTVRSQCHRRWCQLTRSSLSTLGKHAAELFNPGNSNAYTHTVRVLEEFDYPQGDDTRVNVRHDAYNTDRFARVNKCSDCGLLHPFTQQLDDAAAKKAAGAAGAAGKGADGGGGGGGKGKSSAQKQQEEEQRFATEDCLALWSVLNEPELREIISSRAGAAAWKEVEMKLEQLTAQFKTASSKDDVQSDRYLQANTFFRQFARAHRSHDKKVLLYFGSEARSCVDASSLEPVDLFHHLTQLSTQLQVENQANKNKAAVVQTVLQRMVVERNHLDQTDKLLTDEYRQLHSDTPNRSALADAQYRMLTPVERDLFQRELVEPTVGELNVYIDTKGHVYRYSYAQMVEMRVLNRVDTDPSLESLWSLRCLLMPCCAAMQARDSARLAQFLCSLEFLFLTGHEEHHIVEFHLAHKNTSKLHAALLDLHQLAKDGARFGFVYEPRGDRVEIQESVEFHFRPDVLCDFLRKMSRPRLHNKNKGGNGLGDVTGLQLLGWDVAKFS